MPKVKAEDSQAAEKVDKVDKVEWTAEKEKFLLTSLLEVITYGEINRVIWDLTAERMGGEYAGFTSDKISQRFNKTLKGGELIVNDADQDEFLTGEKLINKKFELGLIEEIEKINALNNVKKKGNQGSFHRRAYLRGIEALESDAFDKLYDERNAARAMQAVAKRNAEEAQEDESSETTLQGRKGTKEGKKKRAATLAEGEGSTLESPPPFKKAKADKPAPATPGIGNEGVTLEGQPGAKEVKKSAAPVAEGGGPTLQSQPVSEKEGEGSVATGVEGEGVTLQGEAPAVNNSGGDEFDVILRNVNMNDQGMYHDNDNSFEAQYSRLDPYSL